MRWIVGSGNHVCWMGLYEFRKQRVFSQLVRPGSIIYDVGAHVGYYTLLASRLTGEGGSIMAFEPFPRNIAFLRRHLEINDVTNVRVFEAAASNKTSNAFLVKGGNSYLGRLATEGEIQVATYRVDDIVAQQNLPPPDLIKMDIEGAEAAALQGMSAVISRHHPTILLATHGDEAHRQACTLLQQHGYHLRSLFGGDLASVDEVLATFPKG